MMTLIARPRRQRQLRARRRHPQARLPVDGPHRRRHRRDARGQGRVRPDRLSEPRGAVRLTEFGSVARGMTGIEADYLVVGAGAMGMAFVDTLLTETDATVVLVDQNHQPGGHWNSVYPFVRLHQPSAYYGVNSRAAGQRGRRSTAAGSNEGFFELATGHEVCAYYDQVMRHQLLPTGRLTYFPMARYLGDNTFRTLDGGRAHRDRAPPDRRRHLPADRGPVHAAGAVHRSPTGSSVVAPNELPRRAPGHEHFTIVGGGKTGMDCCLWLLRNGVPAGRLRWVRPRDSWLLNRANIQPGPQFVEQLRASVARADAGRSTRPPRWTTSSPGWRPPSILLRLDPSVRPTMYHCAIVSRRELEQLRRDRGCGAARPPRARRTRPAACCGTATIPAPAVAVRRLHHPGPAASPVGAGVRRRPDHAAERAQLPAGVQLRRSSPTSRRPTATTRSATPCARRSPTPMRRSTGCGTHWPTTSPSYAGCRIRS